MGLTKHLGILRRHRNADGTVTETDEPDEKDIGIGFSFILEMIRAKVAVNDLDDQTRHILAAMYFGLTLGHKKTAQGLPLDGAASETGFGLQ